MFVCICHGVTDRQIKEAARNGAQSLADLRAATGCSGTCGQCASTALNIVREHHQKAPEIARSSGPALVPA